MERELDASISVSGSPPAGWDEFLLKNEFGTFYQTSHYADYASKDAGLKPFFLTASESSVTVGKLLLFKGSRFQNLLANLPVHQLTTRISRAVLPSFLWVYGPVAINDTAAKALVGKAVEISGGRLANCTPHPLSGFGPLLSGAGLKESKWATFIIDLGMSESELWKNVDHSARKLVNRTLEQVDVVQVESEEDYQSYFQIVNENRKRNGVHPYRYSARLWRAWRGTGSGAVFVAKEKQTGSILAGLGISCFNGYVNEWGAGTSAAALEKKIYAQDAVKWSVIKWAKEKGFRFFDLTGVNPSPANEKEKGIFRFKEKWGGKLVEYGVFRS